jgi:hypothetical protein
MSTRVTEREIMRGEVQDLLHQTFNLIESARREVYEEASRPMPRDEAIFVERLSELVGALGETYEQLRARVLPIIG